MSLFLFCKFTISYNISLSLSDLLHSVWQSLGLSMLLQMALFHSFFFFFKFIYLFIYFWLCWVFVSVRGLPLVAASGVHSSSRCAGLSLSRPLLLQSTSSRCAGSVVVAHRLSCSAACGIFPDQGPNPCPLHWQADSQPLRHKGSPYFTLFNGWVIFYCIYVPHLLYQVWFYPAWLLSARHWVSHWEEHGQE